MAKKTKPKEEPKGTQTRVETKLTTDEILNSMFAINPAKKLMQDSSTTDVVYYTNSGKHCTKVDGHHRVFKDGPDALAKEQDGKYWIKWDGRNFFNPKGLFSDQEKAKKIYGKESKWKWLKVNKKIFDYYKRFLQTGNELHLKVAEQEHI